MRSFLPRASRLLVGVMASFVWFTAWAQAYDDKKLCKTAVSTCQKGLPDCQFALEYFAEKRHVCPELFKATPVPIPASKSKADSNTSKPR
jgi:hypothetical protein